MANRAYHLQHNYKISEKLFNVLFWLQGGVCAICKQPETVVHSKSGRAQPLSVDHDHETGVVRGLLCHRCNVAVGLLQNSPEFADAVADYLRTR